jgi:hypothetical protein
MTTPAAGSTKVRSIVLTVMELSLKKGVASKTYTYRFTTTGSSFLSTGGTCISMREYWEV